MVAATLAGSDCLGSLVHFAASEGEWMDFGGFLLCRFWLNFFCSSEAMRDELYSICQTEIQIGLWNKLQDPSIE